MRIFKKIFKINNSFIGIYADVKGGEKVEWIPNKWFGKKIGEWATWTANFNTDLISYYSFNEGTGTNVYDSVSSNDLTIWNGGIWASGIIGNGYNFTGDEATNNFANTSVTNTDFTMGDNNISI